MNRISRDEIRELASKEGDTMISIYLPTHRRGAEVQQNHIRFKNLLSKTLNQLDDLGLRKKEIDSLIEPANDLLNNRDFWEHQEDGLAVFIAPDYFRYYTLPVTVREMANVRNKFAVKQLTPLYNHSPEFYLLTLSQKQARLFLGNRHELREIDTGEMTDNMEEFMKHEDPERQLQFHTGAGEASGGRAAVFHGHGAGSDESERKEMITNYFYALDKGISEIISGSHLPLILSGIEYYIPIYKKANSYNNLHSAAIEKNPDDMTEEELLREALNLLSKDSQEIVDSLISKFNELVGSGKASGEVGTALKQAYMNRVDTLLVDPTSEVHGKFERDNNEVSFTDKDEPESEDLIEALVMETILHNGDIHAVTEDKLPEQASVAAIFRF
ncbi:MAG: hypothetical protein GF315_06410 [candidate division Zixibacteria bacterium]|nr:hypothetical protein [candidate division Zixibacteria bacterium]